MQSYGIHLSQQMYVKTIIILFVLATHKHCNIFRIVFLHIYLPLYKAEKPSVHLPVRPSMSQDNLSGFCMDQFGTWFVHS